MKTILESIFGTYSPLVDESGEVLQGLAGVDFEYIAGIVIFCILLYGLIRLLGVFLSAR